MEKIISDELVYKMIDSFFCHTTEYEGEQLDYNFLTQNIDSTLDNEQIESIKKEISNYIYNWFDQNKEFEISNGQNRISVKNILSKFIIRKAQTIYPDLDLSCVGDISNKLDSIIFKRKTKNISIKDEAFSIEKEGKNYSIPYDFVSRAFYAVTSYMMENDSIFLEDMKKVISQASSKDNGEDLQKIFFIIDSSNSNDFVNDGMACLIYENSYDIVPANVGLIALEYYISKTSYTSMEEVEKDPNIQYVTQTKLDEIINDSNLKCEGTEEIDLSFNNFEVYEECQNQEVNNQFEDILSDIDIEDDDEIAAALSALQFIIEEDLKEEKNLDITQFQSRKR